MDRFGQRRWEWDALRGLMLVLMTVTHFPTQFSDPFGQPFGFVSSAEGFVFLSACLVGRIATTLTARASLEDARRWLWRRAAKVYAAHLALLIFLLGVLVPSAARLGDNPIANLSSYYLQQPARGFAESLVLMYNPPLLDILPMYVLFLALTPALLALARRVDWPRVIVLSVAVWLAAQFDAGYAVYSGFARLVGWSEPYAATGAFTLMAWQLLWVVGVYAGQRTVATPGACLTLRPAVANAAIAVAILFFVVRHATGQIPFGATHVELNAWFDKWHLAPLRLVDFAALLVVLQRLGPRLALHRAIVAPLAFLGRASLPVFCMQLVLCMSALAWLGESPRPLIEDVLLLASAFALMAMTAWVTQHVAAALGRGPEAPAAAVNARGVR
jgi:hypothetical protein